MSNSDTAFETGIKRIVALQAERKQLGQDINDEFAALKSQGHNPKAIKEALKRAKMKESERMTFDAEVSALETAILQLALPL